MADSPPLLPVVLLHGGGQGPMAWQPVVDVIGTSRRIIAPWLHGMRPGRTEEFDVDTATGAVSQQLELQGLQRVALVGLSLGAVVAARLTATRAELVDRLLLASPPVSPPGWLTAVQRGMVAVTPKGVFTRQGVTKDAVRSALSAVAAVDLRHDLAQLTLSPYVVVGARDRAGQLAIAEIQRRLPGSTTAVVEGAGTDLLRDAGPETGRLIADWLARP